MYLIERLDEWLEAQQPAEGAPPVYGLIAVDEQREIGREIVESFAFWRDYGTDSMDTARATSCISWIASISYHRTTAG